jgi:hypothetical protein
MEKRFLQVLIVYHWEGHTYKEKRLPLKWRPDKQASQAVGKITIINRHLTMQNNTLINTVINGIFVNTHLATLKMISQ